MATTFSDIILNNAMKVIDDVRWQTELQSNPALFMRQKAAMYVPLGIARFVRPCEMQAYLTYTAPAYADYYYTAPATTITPTTIQTEKTGFELCSTGLTGIDKFGNPYYNPVANTYDKETGDVTISVSLDANQTVQIDFYTDGVFDNELDVRQCRILGLCVAYDWFCNYSNTYLNLQNKINDTSFSIKSENEGTRVASERRRLLQEELDGELRKYEQDIAYRNVVPIGKRMKIK